MRRTIKRLFGTTIGHVIMALSISIIALLLLILWMNSPFSFPEEASLLKLQSATKNELQNKLLKSSLNNSLSQDVCFINAGSAIVLMYNPITQSQEYRVDRFMIDSFLRVLNRYPKNERVVICDIEFDRQIPFDTTLANTLAATPNFFWPDQTITNNPTLSAAIPKSQSGYVNVVSTNEWKWLGAGIFKFELCRSDSEKSMVLKIYESMHKTRAKCRWGFLWLNHQLYANNITLDETVRTFDLLDTNRSNPIYPIEVAIDMVQDSEFVTDVVSKRYVLIGEFNHDKHPTAFGDTWGTLINLNLLLSLEKNENRIGLIWGLFLVIGTTGIVHYSLFGKEPTWLIESKKVFFRLFGIVVGSILLYIPIVYTLAIVSYFVFDSNIEVIALSSIISVLLSIKSTCQNIIILKKQHPDKNLLFKLNFVFTNNPNVSE